MLTTLVHDKPPNPRHEDSGHDSAGHRKQPREGCPGGRHHHHHHQSANDKRHEDSVESRLVVVQIVLLFHSRADATSPSRRAVYQHHATSWPADGSRVFVGYGCVPYAKSEFFFDGLEVADYSPKRFARVFAHLLQPPFQHRKEEEPPLLLRKRGPGRPGVVLGASPSNGLWAHELVAGLPPFQKKDVLGCSRLLSTVLSTSSQSAIAVSGSPIGMPSRRWATSPSERGTGESAVSIERTIACLTAS